MENLKIKKADKIIREMHIPGDKSISHRAVMLGAIADGETRINNFLDSEDCLRTVECFRALGVNIEVYGLRLTVYGNGLYGLKPPRDILYAGNSGTTVRLMAGILAGQSFESIITGDASLKKRPMRRIIDPLTKMGAHITAKEGGFCPLTIEGGRLKGITYELPVASAQVKSCIMLAGLYAEGKTKVVETIPSRDHTERMLECLGGKIQVPSSKGQGSSIIIESGELEGKEIDIPGDISSAAYFLVAGAIVPGSDILIKDVGVNPTRTGILEVLHRMGADTEVANERILANEPRADIRVRYTKKLSGIEIKGKLIPRIIDEIPIIAVLAALAEGKTVIADVQELRVKESDRIATVAEELRKFGVQIEEKADGMIIYGKGGGLFKATAPIMSHGDHRVAMSMAVAALVAEGETEIQDTDCIDTSFPGFAEMVNG